MSSRVLVTECTEEFMYEVERWCIHENIEISAEIIENKIEDYTLIVSDDNRSNSSSYDEIKYKTNGLSLIKLLYFKVMGLALYKKNMKTEVCKKFRESEL